MIADFVELADVEAEFAKEQASLLARDRRPAKQRGID